MQSEDVAQNVEPEKIPVNEKMIKQRVVFREVVWREIGDNAESLDLTREEYLERAHSFLCDKDSTIAEYKKMLEAAKSTIEDYRRRLAYAGIDINNF